ncbi:MAG: hypothetical protein KDN19_12195 [Verrucomicrobiae bacterium]|nr:hypothetical protein [Verrucomicrobiae bacterium]
MSATENRNRSQLDHALIDVIAGLLERDEDQETFSEFVRTVLGELKNAEQNAEAPIRDLLKAILDAVDAGLKLPVNLRQSRIDRVLPDLPSVGDKVVSISHHIQGEKNEAKSRGRNENQSRALLAARTFEERYGQAEFTSRQLTDILREDGGKKINVTNTMEGLKNQKPSLVRIKEQAGKREYLYALTEDGRKKAKAISEDARRFG